MKAYCPLINNKLCKYGGNKAYNYGFVSGLSSYCRLVKKWVHDLKTCPLIQTTPDKLVEKAKSRMGR
jgi:hypothetical protein